jgi:hypothetical protein
VTPLESLIAQELDEPVDARIAAMAAAVAAQHGGASLAVLFYGSCLRESKLDGLMLDFYLIVSDYRAAYAKRWLAAANRLIPPNVFPFVHEGLSAKYAVLSREDFAALIQPAAKTVSVWARFAQPVRLVWAAHAGARKETAITVAQAPVTLTSLALPMAATDSSEAVWRTGFALTYGCELRAERNDRSGAIIDADPDRYARISALLPPPRLRLNQDQARDRWAQLRRTGKILSIVRLAKASLTFAGGIDYLAWKINRHAGTKIQITAWQRRWPLLGALILVPRLFRQGAIK